MSLPRSLARPAILAALTVAGLTMASLGRGPSTSASPSPGRQDPQPTLEGGIDWFNTDRPIHLNKLRGKIVILDFWTYCCINCHHIIPTLTKLEAKYKNQLVVIGVHSGKFDAEKDSNNIRKKIAEYNIRHPVVNDANQAIWNGFGVRSWPTLVLIGPDGQVIDQAGGEVSFEVLDRVVGNLVRRAREAKILDETPVQFFTEREKPHKGGLLYPGKVLADKPGGRLFISDTGHNRIVVTDLSGKFQESFGSGVEGLADGGPDKAMFNRPQGTCLVGETLYVADTENHAIRAIDLKAKDVKTVAGNGRQAGYGVSDVKGAKGSLSSPWDLVLAPDQKHLYVAMAGPHQIWTHDIARGESRLWAGDWAENIADNTIAAASFAQPSGLASDGKTLYVADSEGSAVRAINLDGRSHGVKTIVGTHDLAHGQSLFAFGDRDGRGPDARLQHDLGVTYGAGKLYIADTYNNKVKVYDPATQTVSTFGPPSLLDEPGGLSVTDDKLYIADTNHHEVRAVSLDGRTVETLKLDSVKAPMIKSVPTFPNATVVDVPPVKAAPGKLFALSVKIPLPEGLELNEQAPLTYLVEAPDKPEALSDQNPKTGGTIEKPTLTFSVPVPLASEASNDETLKLKLSLRAMVCKPNSYCTVKNFVWNIPVTFAAGAPGKVTVGQ
jgi:DNA-binding beta-propeller fold protein YncE